MKTGGTNLLLLTISAFWSSSRWPLATKMSSRRQRDNPLGGRYRQVSLYMNIALRQNPWHCNGSFSWMIRNLYDLGSEMIYARPSAKAYICNVNRLICKSTDTRHDTTVVPLDVIESVNISIRFLSDLAGKCYFQFVSKVIINFINLKLFITSERLPIVVQTIRTTLIDVD